ncbi:hypothetical protein ABZY16_19100 [Streptomyces sp. NPDC006553]|uniref:hypothetical protein n=1 Tax=unclassified Streptomyces TaxID=2593676 RepID=UPI002257101E|nr:hypothetical protein [Streptomyces sp. NBC_00233]MCX5226805.1 hypothetical protein [Streptomyces sp. NBC_00233]
MERGPQTSTTGAPATTGATTSAPGATGTTTGAPGATGTTTGAPGSLASFVRFVIFGGGVGLASSAAVALLAALLPFALANALVTVVSTVLATELHARFTFAAGLRPSAGRGLLRCGLRHHLQSAGTAAAAFSVTTLAMLVLHAIESTPGLAVEQTVYLSASGLAGVGRFLALRLYVFATARKQPVPVTLDLHRSPMRRESLTIAS